ncbi:PaaI family thioesterase [Nitrospirillum sp. BR 11828]|uniref:PaaI family thioesterase n=1 Tax=Nitrospirillum sp. BR 11828 TaxID=3104325 RepID=UPI002ACAC684|nr:PaaI family thioesterase [Nitrospirillum sp. BR 11828]MDZ5649083.1 PaaI family thioesterase [Nitrospirillum sp. BR 11828]
MTALVNDAEKQVGEAERLAALARMDGLAFLHAMMAGDLPPPPINQTLGFTLTHAEVGYAVFTGTPVHAYYNPIGSVHGGWIATLLDSCMACAVQTTLTGGRGYTTLELKINYVRAVTEATGPVRAEGRIIHAGGRTATSEGRLLDGKGRLLAHGTTTCLMFDPRPPQA